MWLHSWLGLGPDGRAGAPDPAELSVRPLQPVGLPPARPAGEEDPLAGEESPRAREQWRAPPASARMGRPGPA